MWVCNNPFVITSISESGHERVNMLHFTSRLCQPQKRHVYNSKQTKPIWTYLHYTTLIWRLKCIVYRLHNLNCVHLQVYAVGGYDGQSRLSSVECYDSFSNRWTEVAPMKEAVSSPAVASCVNKLFVIGGGPDDNTCSDKVCWRVWRMVLRSRVFENRPVSYLCMSLHIYCM